MKNISLRCLMFLAVWHVCYVGAQLYDTNNVFVRTFAGSGLRGIVDGNGTQTMFGGPWGIVADSSGNLFTLDDDGRIRKITPEGMVSSFVGGGKLSLPGDGTNVALPPTHALMIDRADIIWAASRNDRTLLRIQSDGHVLATNLMSVSAVGGYCLDSKNYFYTAGNHAISRWRIDGFGETFVGSTNQGSRDGNGIFTSFNAPTRLAADAADNIYVWDSGNYLIRKINQNRDVVTFAGKLGVPRDADGTGTNASFARVESICTDEGGNLILACGSSVRKITPTGIVSTIAGSFSERGDADGLGINARFSNASDVCVSKGSIFVADTGNHLIRKITFSASVSSVLAANLQLDTYPGLQITGTVGRTYRIESSTDTTNWSEETKILLTSSPHLWIDSKAIRWKKFYAAFLLP
jgi:hypothetical protein